MKSGTIFIRISIVLLAFVMVTAVVKTADARYYDAALGRFLSPDPVEGPNRYAYVRNNPVNMVDPTGNSAIECNENGQCGGMANPQMPWGNNIERLRTTLVEGMFMVGPVGGLVATGTKTIAEIAPVWKQFGRFEKQNAFEGVQDIKPLSKHITEEVGIEVNVVKFLKVKGRLTSLAFIQEPSIYSGKNIHRDIFYVPGNAKELEIDEILETRLSSLGYSMNPVSRKAEVVNVESPGLRRFGLSKSLFGFAFRDMKQHGMNEVFLTWDGEMQEARTLYESLGFRPTTPGLKPSSRFVDYVLDLKEAVVHNLDSVKSWWTKKEKIK